MELGLGEMILIGLVLVVFFGPKKLPELGGSIGKAIRDFKRTLYDTTSDLREHIEAEEPRSVAASTETPPASGEASKAADSEHTESTVSSISTTSDLREHIEAEEHRSVAGSSETPPASGEASKTADSEHMESTKLLSSISSDRSS